MARYAIANASGTVLNVVEWDGLVPYDPGEGMNLVELTAGLEMAAPLDTISGGALTKFLPAPPNPKPVLTAEEKLAKIGLTVAELKVLLGLPI